MVQRIVSITLAASFALGAVSCKKSQRDLAAQKQEAFKREQKAKALKAYQDLVKKYPDSEYAAKAKERIRTLTPPATPKK